MTEIIASEPKGCCEVVPAVALNSMATQMQISTDPMIVWLERKWKGLIHTVFKISRWLYAIGIIFLAGYFSLCIFQSTLMSM